LSGELIQVVRLLKLGEMRDVALEEIQRAARRWAHQQHSNPKEHSYGNSASFFIYAAKKWLRFHGRLKMPCVTQMRFADQLGGFARHITEEQGLSPQSVRSHCWKTSKFLAWLRDVPCHRDQCNKEVVDDNREKHRFDEGELCRKILNNIVGFDLNPLAVMAARTNYLIAIRDLINRVDKTEIPVYLCDSVLTPSEYGGLFTGKLGTAKHFKTAVADFLVPSEITESREDVAKYAEQIEFCVKNAYSASEFLQRCHDEGLATTSATIHTDLYNELVALDRANKNGVWARIIKNAFAPLFVGKFDFVSGNPPWVNWRNLPPDYRASVAPLWERYGLFTKKGLEARLGAGMDDISVLMTYVSGNTYLSSISEIAKWVTSMPIHSRLSFWAAWMVVPHPQNGSKQG
jgi:hypothetical protein